ncbi:unnamed protein product [Gemmata massiliana]|uniref:Uncharacterized protein n=1 Tax=Gemmata massiliana TaxID=1210884 RepID=A0A6P2CW07_9BACT|nr:helix-turn-helix domain-containing protein [Gemmata massiliana]VTR92787.1 unnamed protein product [Gemmata massiliana]
MPAAKHSPEDPAPDHLLIDTARQYARRVAGQELQQVALTLADGAKHILDMAGAPEWPPMRGWSVRGDQGSRNGEIFRLTGKPLAVFTALVRAGDDGLTLLELKRAVWDEHAEDRSAQNAVSKVRRIVREGLKLRADQDPVEIDGERYRLSTA